MKIDEDRFIDGNRIRIDKERFVFLTFFNLFASMIFICLHQIHLSASMIKNRRLFWI